MTTNLDRDINTQQDAEQFLTDLIINSEIYHCEDNAHDIIWQTCPQPTFAECEQLNALMEQVCKVHPDPCAYCLECEAYLKTGNEANTIYPVMGSFDEEGDNI